MNGILRHVVSKTNKHFMNNVIIGWEIREFRLDHKYCNGVLLSTFHKCKFRRMAKINADKISDTSFTNCDLGQMSSICDARYKYKLRFNNCYNQWNPAEYLKENFEYDDKGLICYKIFMSRNISLHEKIPDDWTIEPGSFIEEVTSFDMSRDCAHGVNVASLDWVTKVPQTNQEIEKDFTIWQCRIRFEDLPNVVVPEDTNGKIRASRVELLNITTT